jgi:hypothetical protein
MSREETWEVEGGASKPRFDAKLQSPPRVQRPEVLGRIRDSKLQRSRGWLVAVGMREGLPAVRVS